MDTLTPIDRSRVMAAIRGKDTKPELLVRRVLHRLGYRFRLHVRLPGRPDIAFRGRRRLIFVHGCFWHRHPGCALARMPKSRLEFWVPKLEANRARDLRVQETLREEGWEVLVIWECELRDTIQLAGRLVSYLGPRAMGDAHADIR